VLEYKAAKAEVNLPQYRTQHATGISAYLT